MRRQLFLIIFLLFSLNAILSQQDQEKPTYLLGPENWRFERIDLPLPFASQIAHKGFEELRFAPGMFNVDAETYFTYVFLIEIQDNPKFLEKDLKALLVAYYKGLCKAVASSKKFDIDYEEIEVNLKHTKSKNKFSTKYDANVVFFDTFNDGRRLLLKMDIEVISNKKENKSHIIALVSPKSKPDLVWTRLEKVKTGIKIERHVNN
ncbi:hypothetical protein ABN763_17245 [Spongiivirga sp. MCCC 1A20706]|uniref:hypothetical protein n=1 Tax=Spongiivirga sp. MCCC 1A20706 TaxID=3160963 RepID=UPI0039775CD2